MLVELFLRLVLMFLKRSFNLNLINYSAFSAVLYLSPVSSPSFESIKQRWDFQRVKALKLMR